MKITLFYLVAISIFLTSCYSSKKSESSVINTPSNSGPQKKESSPLETLDGPTKIQIKSKFINAVKLLNTDDIKDSITEYNKHYDKYFYLNLSIEEEKEILEKLLISKEKKTLEIIKFMVNNEAINLNTEELRIYIDNIFLIHNNFNDSLKYTIKIIKEKSDESRKYIFEASNLLRNFESGKIIGGPEVEIKVKNEIILTEYMFSRYKITKNFLSANLFSQLFEDIIVFSLNPESDHSLLKAALNVENFKFSEIENEKLKERIIFRYLYSLNMKVIFDHDPEHNLKTNALIFKEFGFDSDDHLGVVTQYSYLSSAANRSFSTIDLEPTLKFVKKHNLKNWKEKAFESFIQCIASGDLNWARSYVDQGLKWDYQKMEQFPKVLEIFKISFSFFDSEERDEAREIILASGGSLEFLGE
ncbi:MAG: hypothetical protein HOO06_12770 [Bdellovibrionaceae bacterium]|jgi:hypothetical protein|nr:hypothetical protein [Pseudobdellovibrionaceae bacterium]